MISLKTDREITLMRECGKIAAKALQVAGKAIEPGVTTKEIDTLIHDYIVGEGAYPSSLGYGGFPGSACISVNNVVIHGIPSQNVVIKNGDIVTIDVTVLHNGFNTDNAYTFACGDISKEAKALLKATQESLYQGIAQAKVGNRIGDVGSTIQRYVEARGYSVVRDFVGHGVGAKLHEEPNVPNFGTPGRGVRLLPGMTIAIEPMVNEGVSSIKVLNDEWTVVTTDGKLSAHFEHTVAITKDGPLILTQPE